MGKWFNRRRVPHLVGVIVLYIIAVVGIWFASEYDAGRKTEELLDYACRDLGVKIGVLADGMLAGSAETVINDMGGKVKRLSSEACNQLIRVHGLDEVNFVDGRGFIFASSDAKALNYDMNSAELTREFMVCTNKSIPYVSQDFRQSLSTLGVHRRKYLGVPFPKDNAYIQVGYDEGRLAYHFAMRYNDLMKAWRFGESGCYICAERQTDRILFDVPDGRGGVRKIRGRQLKEIGLDPLKFKDDRAKTFQTTLFGERCYCRSFIYLGHWIVTVVPEREFYSSGTKTTLSAAAILLIVFGIFCYTIGKIEAANKAIEHLRKVEDERREKDMTMAKSIQSNVMPALFPPYPELVDKIDIFAFMRTAKEVGGDFYDFYFVGHGKLALVIADVSGKGVPAALFMMRAKTTLQALLKGGGDLATVVGEANNRLCQDNEANMFVTAWIGIVNLVDGRVEYVNAGHNPPVCRHADGTFDYLRGRQGPPLAAMGGISYRKEVLTLAPGEGICLYTDGVTEAGNRADVLFGTDRLLSVCTTPSKEEGGLRTSRQLCNDILAEVDAFAEGTEQADDITMLVFRLKALIDGENRC